MKRLLQNIITLLATITLALMPLATPGQINIPMSGGTTTPASTWGGGMGSNSTTSMSAEPTETTTSEIFQHTVQGAFECFRWTVRGICVWLVCQYFSCSVDTTIRVQHYTPDVTLSTFHEPQLHPWSDYGRRIATATPGIADQILNALPASVGGGSGSALGNLTTDSAGTKTERQPTQSKDRQSRSHVYRGADAIGNPVNFVQGAITGNFGTSGSGPSSVPVPTPYELMMWLTDFPNQVADQWASIPSSYSTGQLNYVRQQNNDWSGILSLAGGSSGGSGPSWFNQITSLYNNFTGGTSDSGSSGGSLGLGGGNTGGGGSGGGTGGGGGSSTGGGGTVGVASGGSDYMCPPGIMPFGLAFQSDLDAPFWRGIVPLESIYPATWLPGMREIGQGLLQTWGNVWPRQGAIYQQHPVKGAAAAVQRAGDIISYPAQPHIYTRLQLTDDTNYRFFGFQGIREHDEEHTIWQRVFPNPQQSCAIFGADDSTSLIGFGDGHNFNSRGTVWNAWRRQDCCKLATGGVAIFLFSVPP
jgi:TraU protein